MAEGQGQRSRSPDKKMRFYKKYVLCLLFTMYNQDLFYYFAAICSSPCENGGECIAPETCACRRGYTGSTCQIGELP